MMMASMTAIIHILHLPSEPGLSFPSAYLTELDIIFKITKALKKIADNIYMELRGIKNNRYVFK